MPLIPSVDDFTDAEKIADARDPRLRELTTVIFPHEEKEFSVQSIPEQDYNISAAQPIPIDAQSSARMYGCIVVNYRIKGGGFGKALTPFAIIHPALSNPSLMAQLPDGKKALQGSTLSIMTRRDRLS